MTLFERIDALAPGKFYLRDNRIVLQGSCLVEGDDYKLRGVIVDLDQVKSDGDEVRSWKIHGGEGAQWFWHLPDLVEEALKHKDDALGKSVNRDRNARRTSIVNRALGVQKQRLSFLLGRAEIKCLHDDDDSGDGEVALSNSLTMKFTIGETHENGRRLDCEEDVQRQPVFRVRANVGGYYTDFALTDFAKLCIHLNAWKREVANG